MKRAKRTAARKSGIKNRRAVVRRKRPVAAVQRAKEFHVSHAATSDFDAGLRGYFEYRDLGIHHATRGKVVSHIIRARPGEAPHGEWHWHDCDVQFVYVLKGWAKFEYEGVGEVLMQAGTCFYQPPGIRHREVGHSEDLEMIEVVAPGDFKTFTASELA